MIRFCGWSKQDRGHIKVKCLFFPSKASLPLWSVFEGHFRRTNEWIRRTTRLIGIGFYFFSFLCQIIDWKFICNPATHTSLNLCVWVKWKLSDAAMCKRDLEPDDCSGWLVSAENELVNELAGWRVNIHGFGYFQTDYGCDIEKGSKCTYHPGAVHCVRGIQGR